MSIVQDAYVSSVYEKFTYNNAYAFDVYYNYYGSVYTWLSKHGLNPRP